MFFFELATPIEKLRGVGNATASDYHKLGVYKLSDLIQLSPRAYDDRTRRTNISDVSGGEGTINCMAKVLSHTYFGSRDKGKRNLKIICSDENGRQFSLLCFGREFLSRTMPPQSDWFLNANVSYNRGEWQASSFTAYKTEEEAGLGKMLPVYPLAGSLSQRILRRDVSKILGTPYFRFDDEMPYSLYEKYGLAHTDDAIRSIHFPKDEKDRASARTSLAFSELLLMQLSLMRKSPSLSRPRRKKSVVSALERKLLSSLPFKMTGDQEKVLGEIREDIDAPEPMNRLLQGDVGSGKTLVAWVSALHVINSGGQVAFMAPTELLARQHAEKAAELLERLGVRIAFITGDVKGKGRALLLNALKEGEVDIAIGTHALFSKDVHFKDLKYVIIDEQHRFGVEQRAMLSEKGEMPNILLMSATPIPRTLALTYFGDLETSTIKTMPPGRKPVITHLVDDKNRERMYKSVGVEFIRGHQAYFVYPRIDDEGDSDLRDVINMHDFLKKKYPGVPSAIMHSKVPDEEKQKILASFRDGKISYLVSTSVVEVGIDIPKATCIVIEHAERFGLAALHQLRGRVGRSELQSYCFLVCSSSISEEGIARMRVMRDSTDGFAIAEKDLEIRGPGEIAGQRQSGFMKLRFASLAEDMALVEKAREEAKAILMDDRGLLKAENHMLRELLQRNGEGDSMK